MSAQNWLQEKFDMTGKVAVLTGASKGIGKAIAEGLAMCGAEVVVSSRKQEAVDDVAKEFTDKGLKATGIAAKIGQEGEAERLVAAAKEACGRIDIVVNNAACNPAFGPVINTDSAAFDKIINVNVKGVFEVAKAAHPHLVEAGGGSVINIASVGGITPEPGIGIYNMSKAAVISLTKVMAKEWGPLGIRVNAICPGLIQTKMSQALWSNPDILKEVEKQLPLGRIGVPEEIAGLAVLLASPAASYMTGGVYTNDGGFTI